MGGKEQYTGTEEWDECSGIAPLEVCGIFSVGTIAAPRVRGGRGGVSLCLPAQGLPTGQESKGGAGGERRAQGL